MCRFRASRKRSKITILFLSVVLLYRIGGGGFALSGVASAVTQTDFNAMEERLADISDQISQLEEQLADVQNNKSAALHQKGLLDEQIALLNQQIAETNTIISEYDGLISAKEMEIAEIKAREETQYALFCARVRSLEEQGTPSYLSILFDAVDFSDLLDRAMMISEIMDYDSSIIETLLDTQAQLKTAKEELENERANQMVLRDEQVKAQAALEVRQVEATNLVNQILSQENEYQEVLDDIKAEEERVQGEIVRLSQELAAQQSGTGQAALGGYIWPVSSRRITSPFGARNTGIVGASTNHKGVDIGGVGYTSQVCAAKSGTVIISQRSSSYGEYVVVSHGSGNTTLYAHMSSRSVVEGDMVTQGDVLGITGSTGISSGPHLHFEVTEKGVRVDPLEYLTDYVQAW